MYGFIWILVSFIAYKNNDLPPFLELIKFDVIYYIALSISLIGILFILPRLIQIGGRFDFSKINIKSGELDLAEKKDSSILNKNIDEILYFFKATKYQVVVFEDLDRVKKTDDKSNIDIFMKLREINLILNNSEEIEHGITFIYAIKDDNFQGENRTKFFDLIIPIIPFTDYSNSADQLRLMIDRYKESMQYDKTFVLLEDKFINKISLYIDNMRLLINVFNEFVIYKEKLANSELKNYKLFSMIVYKNLLPNDFSKLCLNNGSVFNILEKKQVLIDEKLVKIKQSIQTIKNDIEEIKKESIESVEELRSMFIYHILKHTGAHNSRLYISNKYYPIKDLCLDENFEDLYTADEIWSEADSSAKTFKSIEQNIPGKSYEERLALINSKKNNELEKLKTLLLQKEKEKDLIKGKLFKDLLDDNKIFNEIEEEKHQGLIIFLISNGFIDESYKHYISIFYEKSITKEDRDFMLSIIEKRDNLGYEFVITKVEQIIDQLDDIDFSQKSVLNYKIYNHLFNHKNDIYKTKYLLFINQIQDTQNMQFIDGYLEYKDSINTDDFKKEIFNNFLWLWDVVENSNFLIKKKENYLYRILKYTSVENLRKINLDKKLSIFLANKEDFLDFTQDISVQKIKDLILELNIYFGYLEVNEKYKELFEFIYKNNHYIITFDFIEKILSYFNENDINLELLKSENYTTIKKSSCKSLKEHIDININDYIQNVFLKYENNTNESEDTLIELINNENIKDELKLEILIKSSNKITNIEDIDKKYWTILLEKNSLKSSWENVSKFYNENDKQLNDVLINYLNIEENSSPLLTVGIGKQYVDNNPDFDTKLLRKIIENNSFTLKSYSNLVQNNWYYFNNLNILELNEEKISVLVEDKSILQFSADNYNLLKDNSSKQHISFLIKHINDFIRELKDEIIGVPEFPFNIDTQDVIDLLSSQTISNLSKGKIVETIDFDLITNNEIADLIYSFRDKTIIRAANYTRMMVQYLSTLERKITLIVEQIEEFNDQEFFETLRLLPYEEKKNEYKKIEKLDGKQAIIKNTDYNRKFVEILKDRKFITSSKELSDKKRICLFLKKKS